MPIDDYDDPVAIMPGQNSSAYHEVDLETGDPLCNSVRNQDLEKFEIVERADAERKWYDPCRDPRCKTVRDSNWFR